MIEVTPAAVTAAYVERRMSLRQCADFFGRKRDTILHMLVAAQVPRRPKGRRCVVGNGVASDRMLAVLRGIRDRGEPLPVSKALARMIKGDAEHGLAACRDAGHIAITVERGRRKITFLREPGVLVAQPPQRTLKGAPSAERYRAVYDSLLNLAARNAPLPSLEGIGRPHHCDGQTALRCLAEQGLVTWHPNKGVGSVVTIIATGQVLRTRRAGHNHIARRRQKAPNGLRNAEIFHARPTKSIWGDLADDVTFLRGQGDAIERAGTQRAPAAKLNGVEVDLGQIRARADRIRSRQTRMRASAGVAYAMQY